MEEVPVVGTEAGGTGRRDERIAVLYHLYREELVRLAIGMTGDVGLAEETVQEAFGRILCRRRALRDQQAAPRYLLRGVVAETRAALRRRRALSAGIAAGAFASGHAGAAGHGALLAAVSRLPARRRACLLLRLYAGLSEAETGEVLAIPPRAVKKQAEHGMREVAAAGESVLGAGWRSVPMGVLAQELAGRLRDALDQVTLPEWGWPAGLADLAGRARRRRLRRGIAAVSTIVVALIAVAALLAVPGRPGRGPQAARLAFRQVTSVWFNSPSAVLAYGGGWLFAVLTDPARLVRLDPASLAVTGALPLGSPGFDLDPVAYGDGAVWVAGSSGTQLWRIDPATMRITGRQRTGGDAAAVAYGDGAVWVAGSFGRPAGDGIGLERFDPGSGQLTGLASLPGNQSSSCPGRGRAAASQRLGRPAATLAVGKVILAAGPGTPVYAISPQQMSILRTFHTGTGCDAPPRLAAGPHGLYATVGSAVVRLDLTTGRIAARGPATGLNVPDSEPLIVALGGLWYTPTGFYRVGAAIRLDPVTLTVTARTKIYASALLAVGRNLYVSEYGGIIRVRVASGVR
jgi:DNA-directed RNA polymerase specialized sigma24 family protein/outer membrane protein assembly factor BamB